MKQSERNQYIITREKGDTVKKNTFVIPAECCADDRATGIRFDAAEWFKTATADDIKEVEGEGWGSGYYTDQIARDISGDNPKLACLFDGIDIRGSGFRVTLKKDKALEFLRVNRPKIYAEIMKQNS